MADSGEGRVVSGEIVAVSGEGRDVAVKSWPSALKATFAGAESPIDHCINSVVDISSD